MRLTFFIKAVSIGLLIFFLFFSGTQQVTRTSAKTVAVQPNHPGPRYGIFRVTLNGFKVNHESDDDILEGDGKRDEVFITADVWMLDRNGRFQAAPTQAQSKVMG